MHIMSSMEQNREQERERKMEERTYKTMGGSGALNIAVGVVDRKSVV